MYEERERFSWTSLFIKIIIVIIFILFTIWLLQLAVKSANKDMSNGINVLTDNIFSQNIDKMKEVGKSYFTTERLPQKIGEVKTLTLEEMYKKNLILEVKDKNGKACSAKKSYVTIEKLEAEYQMKVYLECGSEHDFINVIMGCYNYCNTDICEKKEVSSNKAIEYEYSKTTGGAWGPWGSFTNWSTAEVSKTDYRDVETKIVIEPYTYEKTTTKEEYVGVADVCATLSGYKLLSNKDGVCTYRKATYSNPDKCPELSGYKMTQDGFDCTYTRSVPVYSNPDKCPELSGYKMTQDGFDCTYTRSVPVYSDPDKCPELSGYKMTQDGFNCTYTRTTTSSTEYELVYYGTGSGSYVPADTDKYHYVKTSSDYVFDCNNGCSAKAYYTYTIYTKKYKTITETKTSTVGCSVGEKSGKRCVTYKPETKTSTVGCLVGEKSGKRCVTYKSETKTSTVGCSVGEKSGKRCVTYKSVTKPATCPTNQTQKDNKCYKNITSKITIEDTRKVTYYRYRLRDYNGGVTDYKWSPSNNDKSLLDAGYKLTGRTREVGGK